MLLERWLATPVLWSSDFLPFISNQFPYFYEGTTFQGQFLGELDQNLNDVVQEITPVIASDNIFSLFLFHTAKQIMTFPIRSLYTGKNGQHFLVRTLSW